MEDNRQNDGELAEWWAKASQTRVMKVLRKVMRMLGKVFHWLVFHLLMPMKWRSATKRDIYTVIFKADTPGGKKFDIWLLVLILLNIVLLIVDSMIGDTSNLTDRMHRDSSWVRWVMKGLEWGFTALFTFEYYLRIYCLKKPVRYVFSFYGLIDFLSIFPAYLSLFIPATQALSVLRLLRLLRIFRIFRMEKFMEESRMLLESLRKSAVKILIFMMFVIVMAVILGTVMYAMEGDVNENMSSIPKGIYWAVVTLTTVGYGDISPVTPAGQFISIIVMVLGYSIIAVPTGIVAGETIEVHKRKKKKTKIQSLIDPTEDDYEEDIN